MSLQLISLNSDLKKLRDDGYDLEVKSGHLLVKNIPYINSKKEIKCGTIVSILSLAGDKTIRPETHVAHFFGEYPCDKNGQELEKIKLESNTKTLAEGVEINHSFSSKPICGFYNDYY